MDILDPIMRTLRSEDVQRKAPILETTAAGKSSEPDKLPGLIPCPSPRRLEHDREGRPDFTITCRCYSCGTVLDWFQIAKVKTSPASPLRSAIRGKEPPERVLFNLRLEYQPTYG